MQAPYVKKNECRASISRDIVPNFHTWRKALNAFDPPTESTTLFDTVAVHMAYSREFLHMEKMKLSVDEKGITVEDPVGGMPFDVALSWTDLEGYCRYLVKILNS